LNPEGNSTNQSSATGKNLSRIACVAIIVATVALFALPVLIYGPMPAGHDTTEHVNFSKHFAEQFWAGELTPHWLLQMNHGMGSPSFFVYPPFPAYVYALLQPIGNVLHFNAFNAGEFLCLLASGICAFLWISTMATRRVALIVAGLYVLIPYHLSADFYRRNSLSESWALAWMPLVLYFTVQVMNKKRFATLGLAIAYALLILSHLISVLIFSAVPIALAFLFAEHTQRIRTTFSVALGMLLGTGLSCFYLVPALSHAKYFPASKWGSNISQHLLVFGKGLLHPSNQLEFERGLSFIVIETLLFIGLCSALAVLSSKPNRKKIVLFWLAVTVIPLFMMTSKSLSIWKALPSLANSIQFPWRLNILLCIAVLPLAAAFLSDIPRPSSSFQKLSLSAALLIVACWLLTFGLTLKSYSLVPPAETSVREHDGWFDSWKPAGMDMDAALVASAGPSVKFLSGNGIATVSVWKPRLIEFTTDSATDAPTGGLVAVKQFYFPAWQAHLISGAPVPVSVALPPGLIELQVPPGHQQVELEIPRGNDERIGAWLSAFSALICIALLFFKPRHRAPGTPTILHPAG
jgi:6-pyruvoyl-tetrahydropterin synthase related domain